MLALVTLDTFDNDFACCAALRFASFVCFGFGGFLLSVFFCALLGINA
jgi:hypothetical protein